jgi:hypothetical protein
LYRHVNRRGGRRRRRRGSYRVLLGKCEEVRLLGTFWRKWEGNIKMGLKEMGWGHGLD